MRGGGGGLPGLLVAAALWALLLLQAPACGGGEAPPEAAEPPGTAEPPPPAHDLSERARAGEELFNANCQACHGPDASGTEQGPTFLSRIYHPGHHADFSFVNAVRGGVRAHHWSFGDMPAVPGLSDDEVQQVICYVRELQRAGGLFSEESYLAAC